MTLPELQARARNNFVTTYIGLAQSARGVRIDTFDPFILCRSDEDVPLANFAVRFERVTERDWDALQNLGQKQVSFRAYTMDGDTPAGASAALMQRGFVRHGQLRVLARVPDCAQAADPRIVEAISPKDRREVTDFMVRVFFENRSKGFYDVISGATSASPFRLFATRFDGLMVGAVMITQTPTELGLYNLCVQSKSRLQGIGALMVEQMASLAHLQRLPLILQCAPRLKDWYQAKRFAQIANVESFCLK